MRYLVAAVLLATSAYSESSGNDGVPDPLCAKYQSDDVVYIPDPTDCSKYLACFAGIGYRMDCPESLYWNEAGYCDYLSNVRCDRSPNSPDSPDSPNNPDESNPEPEDPSNDWIPDPILCPAHDLAFFPDPSDCTKYLECFEGKRIRMNCPNDLYWNEVATTCDYLENVDCNRSPSSPNNPDNPNEDSPNPDGSEQDPENPSSDWIPDAILCPEHDLAFFPDPSDCSKYLECYEGKRITMNCPKDLYWNEVATACDYLENVDCTRSPNSPNTPDDPNADPGTPNNPDDSNQDPENPSSDWIPDAILCPEHDLAFFPDPSDCSKYLECYEGKRITMNCPKGLYWNEVATACDYLENVDCTRSPNSPNTPDDPNADPGTPNNPDDSNQDPENPSSDWIPDAILCPEHDLAFFPDPSDCSKYLECYEGKRITMNCPKDLYWNEAATACDYLENVDCTRSPNSPNTPDDPNADPGTPNNPDDSNQDPENPSSDWIPDAILCPAHDLAFFPDPSDCSKYLECYEGKRITMNCPSGLYWNEVATACDYLENVDCNRSPHSPNNPDDPNADTPSNGIPDPLLCPADSIFHLPDPTDCTKFLECYEGIKFRMNCPKGLYWNQALDLCDYLENVNCNSSPETPDDAAPVPEDPGNDSVRDPLCTTDDLVFFADPSDCSKYLECYGGNKYRLDCPNGLYWNDKLRICDYLENVDCNRSPDSPDSPDAPNDSDADPDTPDIPNNSGPVTLCENQPDGTYLANPDDCTAFYDCLRGEAIAGQCGPGLRWNQRIVNCDYEANVKC